MMKQAVDFVSCHLLMKPLNIAFQQKIFMMFLSANVMFAAFTTRVNLMIDMLHVVQHT